MESDDLEPMQKKAIRKDLAPLGLEALQKYICELEQEIERVKEEVARKSSARNTAESFFKK